MNRKTLVLALSFVVIVATIGAIAGARPWSARTMGVSFEPGLIEPTTAIPGDEPCPPMSSGSIGSAIGSPAQLSDAAISLPVYLLCDNPSPGPLLGQQQDKQPVADTYVIGRLDGNVKLVDADQFGLGKVQAIFQLAVPKELDNASFALVIRNKDGKRDEAFVVNGFTLIKKAAKEGEENVYERTVITASAANSKNHGYEIFIVATPQEVKVDAKNMKVVALGIIGAVKQPGGGTQKLGVEVPTPVITTVK